MLSHVSHHCQGEYLTCHREITHLCKRLHVFPCGTVEVYSLSFFFFESRLSRHVSPRASTHISAQGICGRRCHKSSWTPSDSLDFLLSIPSAFVTTPPAVCQALAQGSHQGSLLSGELNQGRKACMENNELEFKRRHMQGQGSPKKGSVREGFTKELSHKSPVRMSPDGK